MPNSPALPQLPTTGAFKRLRDLARTPHDLTASGGFTAERIAKFRASVCEFDVLYAAERVTADVMKALADLANEMQVTAQFRAALRGEVVNRIEGYPSENRRVLHFAGRDVFDALSAPADAALPSDAVTNAREELARLKRFLDAMERGEVRNARSEPFNTLINVGIGGSDLGPRALYLALQPWRFRDRHVHFVSNVDPDDVAQVLRKVQLSRTLVSVVSKSGSTLETRTNEELLRSAFVRAGLDPALHFVCVTGVGSPLDQGTAYREKFHMFDYVGGRYSSTSMVGGVSLGFGLGFDAFLEFLKGAREMDLASLGSEPQTNLPLLMALLGVWNRTFLGSDTLAVIPYSQALSRFVAHLQQLDMESNGKSVSRTGAPADWGTGPIVWGEAGTNGQHAFFQLLHQGTTVVPIEFIGFRESQYSEDLPVDGTSSQQKLIANLLGQVLALAVGKPDTNPNRRFPGNRPSLLVLGQRLTPRVAGRLLALYENKVAYQGLLWGINSFDQEGVELGKSVTLRILPQMAAGATQGADHGSIEAALLRAAGMI